MPFCKACVLKSGVASIKIFVFSDSKYIEERSLVFLGLLDIQTSQLHPILGVPSEAPQPKIIHFNITYALLNSSKKLPVVTLETSSKLVCFKSAINSATFF